MCTTKVLSARRSAMCRDGAHALPRHVQVVFSRLTRLTNRERYRRSLATSWRPCSSRREDVDVVAAPSLERITVADAVARYLAQVQRAVLGRSLAVTTAANYERDLAEFTDIVGPETILDDLTASDIDEAVLTYAARPDARFKQPPRDRAGQVKTRGTGAQARFRQSVSRLFAVAALEGWVEASPMPRTVVRPQARGMTNVARRALGEQATAELLTLPHSRQRPPASSAAPAPPRTDQRLTLRDAFVLTILVESGPRVSEICRADQSDVEHRDDGTTWLRVLGKGSKERWLPLSQDTWRLYQQYIAHERPAPKPRRRRSPDGDWVEYVEVDDADRALLLTWRGLRMTPRDVQLMVARYCRLLPPHLRRDVTPHGLRHTAATLLLASGAADVRTVKELLGHASIATTGVYLDTVAAELAAAVAIHPVTGRPRNRVTSPQDPQGP